MPADLLDAVLLKAGLGGWWLWLHEASKVPSLRALLCPAGDSPGLDSFPTAG